MTDNQNGRTADPLNVAIGGILKHKRELKGWSREYLSTLVNVTHQQIQKYERGTNCMRPHMLLKMAIAFECDINDFFNCKEYESLVSEGNNTIRLHIIRNLNKLNLPEVEKAINIMLTRLVKELR